MSTTSTRKAYFVGGGIGSLAAAAFLIRDGGMPGSQISILEAGPVKGGSLDGAGDADRGYSMRGGRMLTTDNYECTNFAFISQFVDIPLDTVFTVEFSVRVAQMAVYQLLDISQPIPPVTPHDKSLHVQFNALVKALK